MGMFPFDEDEGIGGAITKMEGCAPGGGGICVYLNVEGDLDGTLERVPKSGGEIVRGLTPIPPHGRIAIFRDTEGNVVGLHSMS